MQLLGLVLLVAGVALVASFAAYELVREVLLDADLPMALRVGFVLAVAGVLALLGSVARDRWRARKTEGLEEVKP